MSKAEVIVMAVSGIFTVITGVILFVMQGYLKEMKRYRKEREKKEQAKDDLLLGMARASLLQNYYECEKKGYYPIRDREVYGKLFEAYQINGGDGVIDQLAPKLREMPMHNPNGQGDDDE